mgnify:CR=1 FL=1
MAFDGDTARTLVRDAAMVDANSNIWTSDRIDQAIMLVTEWASSRWDILSTTGCASTTSSATTGASWSSGTITYTVASGHGVETNDMVVVSGVSPTGYNGRFPVKTVSATTISVSVASDPGTYSSAGTIYLLNLNLDGISSDPKITARRFVSASWFESNRRAELEMVNRTKMLEWHMIDQGTGEPERICFMDAQTDRPVLHPAPDTTYTLTIKWRDNPTTWTAGTASQPTAFNIEDEILRPMLVWGVPALIRNGMNREATNLDPAWMHMVEVLTEICPDSTDLGIDVLVP